MRKRAPLAAKVGGGAVLVGVMTAGVASVAGAQVTPAAPDTLAVGDWHLAPVIELRARGEYRRFLDDQTEGTIVDRVRLGVDATRDALETRVVLQAAGTQGFGNAYSFAVSPGPSFAGVYEAWVEGHTDSVHPSFLRAGRQAIRWGEGRLLGSSDWSAHGRTLDAVRGRLVAGDGAFEILAAVLQNNETGTLEHPYAELLGARAEWAFDPLFAVEVYGLARIAQNDTLIDPYPTFDDAGAVRGETYTGALRLHGDASPWAWGLEGAYQLGHADALQATRAAGAAAGHVAFTFDRIAGAPSLQVGGSYASGQTSGAWGATYTAFDPLLPDVHTWHGAMDLFSWSNEIEGSARMTVTPFTDALAWVEYRYARLAQPGGSWRSAYLLTLGRAEGGNTDANLGSEIDASLRWAPWSPLALEAGYSVLFVGGGARAAFTATTLEQSGRTGLALTSVSVPDLSHFAYAQATLVFP